MLTSFVSFFAKLKIKHLFVILGVLGLVVLLGLSYKLGDSNGFERSQVAHLKSANQNKDQVIEEFRNLSDQIDRDRELNRQANLDLSKTINNRFNKLATSVETALDTQVIVGTDCRADYAGTIGVFDDLALANPEPN